jgi:hypothetical protein
MHEMNLIRLFAPDYRAIRNLAMLPMQNSRDITEIVVSPLANNALPLCGTAVFNTAGAGEKVTIRTAVFSGWRCGDLPVRQHAKRANARTE